jgi:hypothetical protein
MRIFGDFTESRADIVAACESDDERTSIFSPVTLRAFHREERDAFRSPVFIDYLLIRSLQEFERRKNGKYFETAFVRNKRYRQVNHAVLQRSIASIGRLVGAGDRDASKYASLCAVDAGEIMMKCICKAHGRA